MDMHEYRRISAVDLLATEEHSAPVAYYELGAKEPAPGAMNAMGPLPALMGLHLAVRGRRKAPSDRLSRARAPETLAMPRAVASGPTQVWMA